MKKLLISILTILLILTLVSCNETGTKINNAIIYKVIEGTNVTVTRDGEIEDAYEGMRLKAGDVISTDEESKVYIRIDDTKNILLEYSTSMEIQELSNGKLYLGLLSGEFFFDVTEKLEDDEEMTFNMSSSSMSIRGTSGGGKLGDGEGKFIIYTGLGYVEAKSNDSEKPIAVNLTPNTKVEFTEGEDISSSIVLSTVEVEDIPEVLVEYVKENEEYKEKLIDEGWEDISSDGEIVPPTENSLNEENSLMGFVQNIDGTWTFSPENYALGLGPVYYTDYPNKDNIYVKESVFNGLDQKAEIVGYDPISMIVSGNTGKEVGIYNITITPKYKWSDGSTEAITRTWTIKRNPLYPNKNSIVSVSGNSFEYDGLVHGLSFIGFDGNTMNISGNSGTNAGTYVTVITPKYKWSDGTTNPLKFTWKILKKEVTVTILDQEMEINSTLAPLTSVSGALNSEPVELTITVDTTSLGEKTPVVTPSQDYDNYSFTYNIGTITVTLPNMEVEVNSFNGEYDGSLRSVEVNPSVLAGTVVYFMVDEEDTWETICPEFMEVGEHVINIKVENPDYKTYYETVDLIISKKAATIYVGIEVYTSSGYVGLNVLAIPQYVQNYVSFSIYDKATESEVNSISLSNAGTYNLEIRYDENTLNDNFKYEIYDYSLTIDESGVIRSSGNGAKRTVG